MNDPRKPTDPPPPTGARAPALHPREKDRLETLRSLAVLDTPAEERFDRITRLARQILGTEIAVVSLVDNDRQWFKSTQGLNVAETSREVSFCGHAILQSDPLVVSDATKDGRFAENPLVLGEPSIRFYAGVPLVVDGLPMGTLCAISPRAQTLDDRNLAALEDLARLAEMELKAEKQNAREQELVDELNKAERTARIDGLSRAWNRFAMTEFLASEHDRARRQKAGMVVMLADIDHFKNVNDTYGHGAGDDVIVEVAQRLRRALRPYDRVGRWGGEEFLVIAPMPDASSNIGDLTERACRAIDRAPIRTRAGDIQVTVSIGAARLGRDGDDPTALVEKADGRMYEAKDAGRNCVRTGGARESSGRPDS